MRLPFAGWIARTVSDPAFQNKAARFPLTRPFVRAEGARMFDLVAGFVQSQMLQALVKLDVLERCRSPQTVAALAPDLGLSVDRADLLCRAGVAMGLLSLDGAHFTTTPRGAVLGSVPGLTDMILHHDVLYRDLADPVAFLRGETKPELASFWPYVFGGGAGVEEATRYSKLMADSQALVAEDTLSQVDLRGVARLTDVGGGSGAFAAKVLEAYPDAAVTLFDLPTVLDTVPEALAGKVTKAPASFREDALPEGQGAITLIRVLYDHSDDTVQALLAKTKAALPMGGRLIVSEPMTGGDAPHVAGDVYFATYCAAMGTGQARSQARIAALMRQAGFTDIRAPKPHRAFVTSVVEGRA
ncbi:Demethylspheroidene O-methyltransferase [Rhodobacteraceae bacterium THAF1]|uniref:methyltransferase n=1 Tax=Palleronia sp. THAF1 TaxID=2587842 RepID=UPI000F3E0507|nr:methyltransferase [Palleronia sp. THAF1]QFU09759.1 Demethylspheroidene O-methyltransferase [Palleronia sp. THAF1]VDC17338.1 Demethylspheroidene O-methyltransferase [Rhodobacteraceae bacterium THAF1]